MPIPNSLKESKPLLSIIIATWNADRTLLRCLNSIFEQTFKNWELLISDGGSSDETIDIIKQHESKIAWWNSEPDAGIYDAWNKAIPFATGAYVCFLGADDAWIDDGVMAKLVANMKDQTDLVTSCGLIFDTATGKRERFGSAWNYKRIGRHMVVCHPGMFHRRLLFDRYGLFDTNYRIAGDLEFLLRLPPDTSALHVEMDSVLIDGSGISRKNVMKRLHEQRLILARCPRYGTVRAYLAWLDKLWRFPIARLLGISH